MTHAATNPSTPAPQPFRQGVRVECEEAGTLRDALEAAFDYRGDVTLILAGRKELKGYLANRDFKAPEPFLDLFPADGSPRQRLALRDVRGIEFSGRDTAAGKSWHTWVESYKKKKLAQARGETTGTIGIFPESLDG